MSSDIIARARATGGKIFRFSGFSDVVKDSFFTTGFIGFVAWDSQNVIQALSAVMSRYSGFSSTVTDSFTQPIPSVAMLGTAWYQGNLYWSNRNTWKVYKHNGFNSTIVDSIYLGPLGVNSDGFDIEFDLSGNLLVAAQTGTSFSRKIHILKYSGFSATLIDSFLYSLPSMFSPDPIPAGVAVDSNGDTIAFWYANAPGPTKRQLIKFSGFSSTVKSSLSLTGTSRVFTSLTTDRDYGLTAAKGYAFGVVFG